jgi:hypothetical protein
MARLCGGRPAGDAAEVLERAIDCMLLAEERGGTLSRLGAGQFLQEAPRSPVRHVLNGCLYGLFGLYDAVSVLHHPAAIRAADELEKTLHWAARLFTAPLGWSYYCLEAHGRRYLAREHYHAWHVLLLRVVALRTQSTALGATARAWERAHHSLPRRTLWGAAKAAQVIWMRDIRGLNLDVCP